MSTVKKTEDIKIKDEIVKEVVGINNGRTGDALLRPNMAILMIGEEENSNAFITGLEKEAVQIGVDTHTYKCPSDSDNEEIKAMIECLNDDELIDGIYLQLPLPDNFDKDEILALIKTDKDLNFVLDADTDTDAMREAKLFKGVLDNYKNKLNPRLE